MQKGQESRTNGEAYPYFAARGGLGDPFRRRVMRDGELVPYVLRCLHCFDRLDWYDCFVRHPISSSHRSVWYSCFSIDWIDWYDCFVRHPISSSHRSVWYSCSSIHPSYSSISNNMSSRLVPKPKMSCRPLWELARHFPTPARAASMGRRGRPTYGNVPTMDSASRSRGAPRTASWPLPARA